MLDARRGEGWRGEEKAVSDFGQFVRGWTVQSGPAGPISSDINASMCSEWLANCCQSQWSLSICDGYCLVAGVKLLLPRWPTGG
jgi:hypothetical protein